jgi:hypothetical protein
LVNKPGTSITCSTEEDRLKRLADARGEKPKQNNIETPEQPPENDNNKGKGKGKNKDDNKEQPPKNNDGKNKDDNKEQPPENNDGNDNDNAKNPENFRPKNADDAEKLTEDFKKLTPDSSCKDGEQACVEDQFAQCVNGKFALNSCGGGETKCVVLPLVNKPGTSITCSTEEDRLNRLAEARGENPKEQPKGNDNNIETPENDNDKDKGKNKDEGKNKDDDKKEQPGNDNADQPKQPEPPKSPDNAKDKGNTAEIRKKNADEAEKLQEDFKSFTPDQKCENNEIACVDNKLAQCVGEKFTLTDCGSGLQCSVLPLVLKEGTTVTCTTEADRQARLDEARKNLK